MDDILAVINDQLEGLGLNYEFGKMTQSPPQYPYWVGDYTEPEGMTEDGKEESTVILTGFSRGKFIELETQKATIKMDLEAFTSFQDTEETLGVQEKQLDGKMTL